MNIPSWTGEMVELRERMHLRTPNGGILIVQDYDLNNDALKDCTMLHAPFVVGDEYEWFDSEDDYWHRDGKVKTQAMANKLNAETNELRYRHANEALRTSPDYVEKVK